MKDTLFLKILSDISDYFWDIAIIVRFARYRSLRKRARGKRTRWRKAGRRNGAGQGRQGRRIWKTHLSEGGGGRARLLGLMRCRRYRREGRVRRVRCVRCVWCQRRVILLTAVTAGAPHLEVRTRLVTVVPRLLLHHHPCTQKQGQGDAL